MVGCKFVLTSSRVSNLVIGLKAPWSQGNELQQIARQSQSETLHVSRKGQIKSLEGGWANSAAYPCQTKAFFFQDFERSAQRPSVISPRE